MALGVCPNTSRDSGGKVINMARYSHGSARRVGDSKRQDRGKEKKEHHKAIFLRSASCSEYFEEVSNVAVWPEQNWPLTEMYGQWRAPLLRYLAAMRLTKADSEDVAQEVFLALVHHLQRDGARDNLRGWVFRVGHNLALKRRMQLGRVAESIEVCDPGPSPEDLAVLKRRQERLQAVVAALPERDRCCLVLRAEGLRYREIAEVLEMSLGSVASALARSLGKLAAVEGR